MKILIAGAGQLGSRYLQGLAKLQLPAPANIFVYDPSPQSLLKAKERYEEINSKELPHNVTYVSFLQKIPRCIDLAILSMSSLDRAQFMSELSIRSDVNFWLLEKVLAPSLIDLQLIADIAQKSKGAWVNHWMRLHSGYVKIKQHIERLNLKIESIDICGGGWGLACNATHFIDFASWLSSSSITNIDIRDLDDLWIPSKRPGYFEINGTLRVNYKSGMTLAMTCDTSCMPLSISINSQSQAFKVSYVDQKILIELNSNIFDISSLPLQSEMTAPLVDRIIHNSSCDLPGCIESVELHKFFCTSLLGHWNKVNHLKDEYLCIT
jgi:hypothetical protein